MKFDFPHWKSHKDKILSRKHMRTFYRLCYILFSYALRKDLQLICCSFLLKLYILFLRKWKAMKKMILFAKRLNHKLSQSEQCGDDMHTHYLS